MGITSKNVEGPGNAGDRGCYYCAEPLPDGPAEYVYWFGVEGLLPLHQKCASTLGQHLIKDALVLAERQERAGR